MNKQPVIAILGAGKLGTTLARLAVQAGYEVRITSSGRNSMTAMIVETVAPGSVLASEPDVIDGADVIIAAIPFNKVETIGWEALSGRVVVDAMNHWEAVDDASSALEDTTAFIQTLNPDMRLVKSLNHMSYDDLEIDAKPVGLPGRRGMLVISDDPDAALIVADVVDDLGFDPVIAPASKRLLSVPGGPIFGERLSRDDITRILEGA